MEKLHNGFTLSLCEGAFPLSTDSMVLSDFVKLPKDARVLDLGSGCGTLGLLLCAKDPTCQVTGIELEQNAHACAFNNIERNGLNGRLTSICGNVNCISDFVTAGSFHCCVSNPPYFSAGPKSKTHPLARRDDSLSTEALFRAAQWALRYGGDLFLVHRPEKLAELCACASRHQLEPKRLGLVRHRQDGHVALVLLQCRKGGKPGLLWEEYALQDAQGAQTAYYRKVYHIQEAGS